MAAQIPAELTSEIISAIRVKETEASVLEVNALIAAAAADLRRQGVDIVDYDDPLTRQVIKLYCKGNYGYDKDGEKFMNAYLHLSAGMALFDDYDEKDGDA